MNIIKQYLFWRKYKNRLHEFKEGMCIKLYCIAPNSFEITREKTENWDVWGNEVECDIELTEKEVKHEK